MRNRMFVLILAMIMILSSVSTVFAYENNIEDESKVEEFEVSSSRMISGANGSSIENSYSRMTTRNGAVATAYAHANLYYGSFLNRVNAHAETELIAAVSGNPVPQWTLHVSGVIYKNGHSWDRLASTEGFAVWSVDSSNNDFFPKKGDYYTLDSFHRVYDYNGTKIWDEQLWCDESI